MKKIIILMLMTFVLASCWKEEVKEEVVKKDFVVETKQIDDFSNSLTSTLQNYIIGKTTKDSTLNIVEKLLCKKLIEIIDENV